MNTYEDHIIRVDVSFTFPTGPHAHMMLDLDLREAGCLLPLPSDYDFLLGFAAFEYARKIRQDRDRLLKRIREQILDALVELIQKRDPQNGYYPEETTDEEAGSQARSGE